MRVAAIDCGTNSVRLLIADVGPGADPGAGAGGPGFGTGELADVERLMEIVRLGEGVDRTGRLAPDALATPSPRRARSRPCAPTRS
jgi:exopolyphosphatase/guanosine-5'-triphosphate,3'-diphosphate pyrophosphatase